MSSYFNPQPPQPPEENPPTEAPITGEPGVQAPIAGEPGVEAPAPGPSRAAEIAHAVREIVETILLTLVIFLAIRFVVENYRVEGESMEPDFHNGQFLLVNKLAYRIGKPERFDVIIFHYPKDETQNYIKRVIALPGEKVQIEQGRVFINGVEVVQPFPFVPASYSYPATTIGPDQYFVLGDNRPASSDSHFWGTVPTRDIIGKAWVSYWPPSLWGVIPEYKSTAAASP